MMEHFLLVALTLLGPGSMNKEVAPQPVLEVQMDERVQFDWVGKGTNKWKRRTKW